MIQEAIQYVHEGYDPHQVAEQLLISVYGPPKGDNVEEYSKFAAGGAALGTLSAYRAHKQARKQAAATGQKKPGVGSLAKRIAKRATVGAALGAAAKRGLNTKIGKKFVKGGKDVAQQAWSWGGAHIGKWKGHK